MSCNSVRELVMHLRLEHSSTKQAPNSSATALSLAKSLIKKVNTQNLWATALKIVINAINHHICRYNAQQFYINFHCFNKGYGPFLHPAYSLYSRLVTHHLLGFIIITFFRIFVCNFEACLWRWRRIIKYGLVWTSDFASTNRRETVFEQT